MWLELLANKSEALQYFKIFKAATKLESERHLKAFMSDHGGEFNSGVFVSFCADLGIKHNSTMAYTPQQNGVVE
jgi:transposase InsO family protein